MKPLRGSKEWGSGAGRKTRPNQQQSIQQITFCPPFRGRHYISPSVCWKKWHSSERLKKALRQREVTQIQSLKEDQEMDRALETWNRVEKHRQRKRGTRRQDIQGVRQKGQEDRNQLTLKWGIMCRDEQSWDFTALTKVCTCVCVYLVFTATALNRHRSYQPMIQFPRQPSLFFICRQTCLSETCLSADWQRGTDEKHREQQPTS